MLHKLPQTNDKIDLNWIIKQTPCWVYYPLESEAQIYKKGVIKGVIPLTHNKGNSKVMGLLENGSQFDTKALYLQRRRLSNILEKDLIDLQIINAGQVLNQLKRKLMEKRIHTYLWNSLIILNPFQFIPTQYDTKTLSHYIQQIYVKGENQRKLEPHVYGYMCALLRNMKSSDKVQVLSISGESGSGKTQTNKQCLRTISSCCESGKTLQQQKNSIQSKVLKCDPILQAFGNAKTVKNDNSSRFGKLITLKIDISSFTIVHSEIRNFFLEKSRIISQAPSQRNFHIFYQILKYADPKLRTKYRLIKQNGTMMSISDFNYINKDIRPQQDNVNDQKMWKQLLEAFHSLEYSQKTINQLWQVISAVLLLGNVQFDDTNQNQNESCQVSDNYLLDSLSDLLHLPKKEVNDALVFHRKNLAGEIMDIPLNRKQCTQGRDSAAKAIYECLFQWLINALNQKVNKGQQKLHIQSNKNVQLVKLLDIYGFEVFDRNSFEQLCVNYTNERIHQIYLDQVFKHEKETLKREGLEAIIPQLNFTDNFSIIQLLDTLPKSIYNLLDESCSVNVKDDDFLSNVKKTHENHPHFPSSNSVNIRKSFIIAHTPGHIEYTAQGFRDKNKDLLRQDLIARFSRSGNEIIRTIFCQKQQMLKNQSNKKFLGSKIRKQVNLLANQMSINSELHFIRCIKPNQEKAPFTFVDRVCYNQIKYLGILDTVQMRKDSYHVRMSYSKFYEKYGIIKGKTSELIDLSEGKLDQRQCKNLSTEFMKNNFVNENLDYLFGNNKIFMKMSAQFYLDGLLKNKTKNIDHASTVIKTIYHWSRKATERTITVHYTIMLQRAIRNYLKVAKQVRKKLAVRIIEKSWIRYYQQYYNRKKRKPIMILQKHIKTAILQKEGKQKRKAVAIAKNIMRSAAKTHKVVKNYQFTILMKSQFLGNIYNKLWQGIQQDHCNRVERYVKAWNIRVKNKPIIEKSEKMARYRMFQAYNKKVQNYIHGCYWANRHSKMRKSAVAIQSYFRMQQYRKYYVDLRRRTIIIQQRWRKYKRSKESNTQFTRKYFQQKVSSLESTRIHETSIWKEHLFRTFESSNVYKGRGQQSFLHSQQKIKRQKIILFYYLLDFQLMCDISLAYPQASWIKNYNDLYKLSWEKMNPIQYVDISNTHTLCATTTKLYSWGTNYEGQRGQEDIQSTQFTQLPISNTGRINQIQISQNTTVVTYMESEQTVVFGNRKKYEQSTNKEWKTMQNSFVNLNGTILTLLGTSLIKLNIPEKIVQLSCGMAHIVCRTSLKKVYAWGNNRQGQLGLGHTFEGKQPRQIEFLIKNKIQPSNIGASAFGTVLVDTNCKIWWFGSNGTIKKKLLPEQCMLCEKSEFLDNSQKYSVVRVIPKWSRSMSIIGVTIASYESVFKTQISLRKKTLENLMSKWSQSIQSVNPPHIPNISGYFLERHMPLPKKVSEISRKDKGPNQKEIKDKIINQINFMEQIQRQLLSSRQNNKTSNKPSLR